MSGLSNPEAGWGEKTLNIALPVMAGLAASVHPAAARGLAGITSAINTQSQLRLLGRGEESERALGMKLSDLLQSPTGVEVPDEAFKTGVQNVTGTPEGPVPVPPLTTRPQKLSEALGPLRSKLVETYASTPGYAGQAGAFLANEALMKPDLKLITRFNKQTGRFEQVLMDLSKVPVGSVVGEQPSMREQIQQAREGFEAPSAPEQPSTAPQGMQPSEAPTDAPTAQTTVPPSATPGQFRAAPTMGVTVGKEGASVRLGQGQVKTDRFEAPNDADGGRLWVWQQQSDQSGRTTKPVPLMRSKVSDERSRVEDIVAGPLGVPRDSPNFQSAVADYQFVVEQFKSNPTQLGVEANRIRRQYGGGITGPQPPPARPPAPQGAVSPSPGGALPPAVGPSAPSGPSYPPAPPEAGPSDFAGRARAAETEETGVRARRAELEAAGRERGQANVQYYEEKLGEKAKNMRLGDGRQVPGSMTRAQADQMGARDYTIPPETEVLNVRNTMQARSLLQEMIRLAPTVDLQNIVGGGVFREWVNRGIAQGTFGPIPIPEALRRTMSPDQQRFLTFVADYADTMLRLRSGAQISTNEMQWMRDFLMTPGLTPEAFVTRLGTQSDILRVRQEISQRFLNSIGYLAPDVGLPSAAPQGAPRSAPAATAPTPSAAPPPTGRPATHRWNPATGKIEEIKH